MSPFTPLGLREVGQVSEIDLIDDPEDIEFDEASEKALGEAEGRERVKIATREAMLAEARAHLTADANAG